MRMSVDEAFQFSSKLLKLRAEIKKEAMDDAKSVLNQHRQAMQVRVAALSNKVLAWVDAAGDTPVHKSVLVNLSQEIHDLTQERR